MQARLLVALPILIMIKPAIDHKVVVVTKYLSEALMSPEERYDIVTKVFYRAKKLTSSALTEIILILIVIGLTISLVKGGVYNALEGATMSWMASNKTGNQSLSFAGNWAVFISIPVFSFLGIRWLWRYLIWILLLFRLSKTRLNMLPAHPDRAGGLGIIILAQGLLQLSKLGTALSYMFEGVWVNDLPIERRISEKQIDPSMVFDYAFPIKLQTV